MKVVGILVPPFRDYRLTKCDKNEIDWPYAASTNQCTYESNSHDMMI
jgi:hypothetical protein